MKKRLPIAASIIEYFILISLAMASFFYLNGCTSKAMQIAEEKASPENAEYWKINRVVSAVKHKNGDVSVCAALNVSDEAEETKLITLNLPLSRLSGDLDAVEKLRLRSEECFFDRAHCYWYPIERTKPGCKQIDTGTSFSKSALAVENISVNDKSSQDLFKLIHGFNVNRTTKERIFEFSIISEEEISEKKADACNNDVSGSPTKDSKDVFLIYWPAVDDPQGIQPIVISGVFDDNSTSLYYLTVPLAFAWDVVVVTVVVVTSAFLQCPQCFTNTNN